MAKKDKNKPAPAIQPDVVHPVESAQLAPIVHPAAEGFAEKVTPKEPGPDVFLFKCACGGVHYRHAGYVQHMLPFLKPGDKKEVSVDSVHVMVCVKCRHSFVWMFGQMYDVTSQIDLQAWERCEVAMQQATGPGGDC